MRPTKDVQKFWKALVAAGGSMTRVILRRNVFGSNRSAAELDAFLRCPLLSDLVTETRERDCKTGRPARRYILTAAGWEAARLWQLPTSDNLGLEELRRQFDRLVLAGCPWACDLVRYAELGKQREAKFQAIKEQVRALAAEKLEEWKAAHPIVKHPSKGRNRSPEEMRQRAAWARAHFRKSAIPSSRPTACLQRSLWHQRVLCLRLPRLIPKVVHFQRAAGLHRRGLPGAPTCTRLHPLPSPRRLLLPTSRRLDSSRGSKPQVTARTTTVKSCSTTNGSPRVSGSSGCPMLYREGFGGTPRLGNATLLSPEALKDETQQS